MAFYTQAEAAAYDWRDPELRIGYYRKSQGEGPQRVEISDPCARGAIKATLKRAQALVESNQAISAYVEGSMRYTYDGPGAKARWSFGVDNAN